MFKDMSLFSYQGSLLSLFRSNVRYIIISFWVCQELFWSFLKLFSFVPFSPVRSFPKRLSLTRRFDIIHEHFTNVNTLFSKFFTFFRLLCLFELLIRFPMGRTRRFYSDHAPKQPDFMAFQIKMGGIWQKISCHAPFSTKNGAQVPPKYHSKPPETC